MHRLVNEAITITDALRRSGWRVGRMRLDRSSQNIGFAVQSSAGTSLYIKCTRFGVTVSHRKLRLVSSLSLDAANNGSRWTGPCCPCSDYDDESIHIELERFLNSLNCLPGSGYLKIIANKLQITAYRLPLPMNVIPLAIRKDLLLAMIAGGGCEIRLRIPGARGSHLSAACFQSGRWKSCPPEEVATQLAIDPAEMVMQFPLPESMEHFDNSKAS